MENGNWLSAKDFREASGLPSEKMQAFRKKFEKQGWIKDLGKNEKGIQEYGYSRDAVQAGKEYAAKPSKPRVSKKTNTSPLTQKKDQINPNIISFAFLKRIEKLEEQMATILETLKRI